MEESIKFEELVKYAMREVSEYGGTVVVEDSLRVSMKDNRIHLARVFDMRGEG